MESKFELRSPITPYVCSTPSDFEEEREFLSEHVYPELVRLCQSRGTYFQAVDVQWEVEDTLTQNGFLLSSLLDLIGQTSPYFICLLGETYGPHLDHQPSPGRKDNSSLSSDSNTWLDKNFNFASETGHAWVKEGDYCRSSIPELEIMAACFRGNATQCTFYFRQVSYCPVSNISFQ